MWKIKTEGARGDSRRVQADRDERPRHPDRRVLPALARSAEKFAFIRSVIRGSRRPRRVSVHDGVAAAVARGDGRTAEYRQLAMKLQGSVDASVPPFIGLAEKTQHVPWSDPGQVGFLGSTFAVQAERARLLGYAPQRGEQGSPARTQETPGRLRFPQTRDGSPGRPEATDAHRVPSTCFPRAGSSN